jgi:hypothetical protein
VQTSTQRHVQRDEAISKDDVTVCRNCENVYVLIWLKHGDDYNDFGLRQCPFCGFLTHELPGNVIIYKEEQNHAFHRTRNKIKKDSVQLQEEALDKK